MTSFVTYTDDGQTWSEPQQVYEDNFIFWKPVAHGGKIEVQSWSEVGTTFTIHLPLPQGVTHHGVHSRRG